MTHKLVFDALHPQLLEVRVLCADQPLALSHVACQLADKLLTLGERAQDGAEVSGSGVKALRRAIKREALTKRDAMFANMLFRGLLVQRCNVLTTLTMAMQCKGINPHCNHSVSTAQRRHNINAAALIMDA